MEYVADIALIIVVGLVCYSLFRAQRIALNYSKAMHKVDLAIQKQDHTNQHLMQILNEIRRSNHFLAELVGVDSPEYAAPVPTTTSIPLTTPDTSGSFIEATEISLNEGTQAKVYVGNIDYAATEAELGEYFGQCGQVESVNIPVNRYTGKARGFGFVTFRTQQDAERAMVLNGTEFKSRQIQVNFAKEREASS
jgi:RNA recognition motif-containing protein